MAETYFTSDEVEHDSCELEAMRKRLHQTVARYREKNELHNKLLEHALIIEELMNEVEAENRTLANRKKGLHQQKEQIKKRWEEEEKEQEAEALRHALLAEEEKSQMAQLIWQMEEENANQWLQNENLSAEKNIGADDFPASSSGPQSEPPVFQMEYLKKDGEEYKVSTQEQGFQLSKMEIQKMQEEQMNTIEGLKKEKRELQKQLSDFQEEQTLAALKHLQESFREPLDASTMGKEDESSWCCYIAKGLWKGVEISGAVILGTGLSLGIITCMTPDINCPDPDCSLWDLAFELLELYSEHTYTGHPVY